MIEIIFLISCLWFITIFIARIFVKSVNEKINGLNINPLPPTIQTPEVNLKPLEKQINDLPNKVLLSIQNSTNTYKGALGELIGYINLRASYDRIIPLGSIADFIALKLPTKTEPGMISFIDIKTGHKARLSKDQRALKQLIQSKNIEFIEYKIDDSGINNANTKT